MLGTYFHAFSAGFTFFLIYYRHTVLYMNGIKRTYLHTGSISQAATVAGLRATTGDKAHHTAVLDAVIIIIRLRPIAVSLAVNIRHLTFGSSSLHSHDRSNFFADFFSSYRTGIDRSLSFCNGSCQSGTSGKSTATAVITGKGGKHRLLLLIYFYFEFNTGHAEEQSHKDADDSDTCRSNQNSCYTHL